MDILKTIEFEEVSPSEEEKIGLFRIPSQRGCVEIVMLGQKYYRPHIHDKADARLHVLEGEGKIILNGNEKHYREGDRFSVPRGTSHGFIINKNTIILSIQNKAILDKKTGKIDLRYK